MMRYADQPTPPFNSPYQQHGSRTGSLLEPSYPSPVCHNPQSKYPQGLGLCDYQHALSGNLPPSPQPSEAWGAHYPTSASPVVTDNLANPWSSGAFDHPVPRSPLPWNSAQTSPRSSLSSYTREMSAFSHEDSEPTYPVIKMEQPMWTPEAQYSNETTVAMTSMSTSRQHSLTVAPHRFESDIYGYDTSYTSHTLPKYEPSPVFDFHSRNSGRAPSEESIGSFHSKGGMTVASTSTTRERRRNRRHTDPAHASHLCPICPGKGFARKYNFTQHMLTHEPCRRKENVCQWQGCGKEFVRKTDLARHEQSVHHKSKSFKCWRCSACFSRKDTLKRYV